MNQTVPLIRPIRCKIGVISDDCRFFTPFGSPRSDGARSTLTPPGTGLGLFTAKYFCRMKEDSHLQHKPPLRHSSTHCSSYGPV
jgi:hypothetical protein